MTLTYSNPLDWPIGWPREGGRESSRFQTTLFDAREGLAEQLDRMGATNAVLTSNGALTRSTGVLASQQRWLADPGVALYFDLGGEQRCIPCDRWSLLEDNVQAIRKTIEALRGIERWGAGAMVEAAFRGFAALPAASGEGWWTVLGVRPDATLAEAEAAYRRLAKERHPDAGGSAEAFRLLAEAYRQAREGRG